MIKLGLLGAVKTHAYVFSAIFNGGEEKDWPGDAWKPGNVSHIGDAGIVKVWDEDDAAARLLAKTCNIPEVAATPRELAEGIDAVIMADNSTLKHSRHWRIFLERGIPVFLDKPLADTPESAEEIIQFACQQNCLLMSGSPLRYASEMPDLHKQIAQCGPIRTGLVTGRPKGRLINYGIHAIELLYSAVGGGFESVQVSGRPGRQIIQLNCNDGRVFAFSYCMSLPWEISLLGTEGCAHVAIKDNDAYFFNIMRKFIEMVKTKTLPVPLADVREILKICFAAETSMKTGEEVKL